MIKKKIKRPAKSLRKFIRKEKARIIKELGKTEEAVKKIKELYKNI